MLQDGVTLADSVVATNFQVVNGPTLPSTGIVEGDMFYLTTGDSGLYVATSGIWIKSTAISATNVATNVPQSFTRAQRGSILVLTPGATVTPDFSASNNFSLAPTSAFTLANPTNLVAGQSGLIVVKQDVTGGRVISWGTYFKAASGTKPVLTLTANAVDYLIYFVQDTTAIFVSIVSDVK